jgi:hemoglobin
VTCRARLISLLAAIAIAAPGLAIAAEQPVAPYAVSDANADASPLHDDAVYRALHGREGITRIVADLLERCRNDPRIADIFKATDFERLNRTLVEQICYVSGGPCHYTGRDMKTAHTDMGLQNADFNALVEDLQLAMNDEKVAFREQNRLLAKLAPMQPQVVERR